MKHKIQIINKPNKNGHIYTRECLDKMINDVCERPIYGVIVMIDGPQNISELSHKFINLRVEEIDGDSFLVGDCIPLKTPRGEMLKEMMNDVSFTLAGTGELDENKRITNYSILSINAVKKEEAD